MPTILCHAEGYQKGFASNHGDVLHWFKIHGKTMDNVRRDVTRILIEEGNNKVTQEQFNAMMDVYLQEQAKKPTSNWAKSVMNWAVNEGIIMGAGNGQLQAQKFITREECIALLNRLFNKIK